MSFSNGVGPTPYIPPLSAPGAHPVADPHVGRDDHHADFAEGKPRNLLGNVATIAALVGVAWVWAFQDSLYLAGFIISGLGFVAGAIALFLPRLRRKSAFAGVLIGAFPFLFTLARFIFQF